MGVKVGLSDVHYAILTTDTDSGATYEAPVKVPGAITAKISPKVDSATLFADDGPSETASALGDIEVEIEMKDIPLDVQAAWLGHSVSNGVMTKKSNDTAPYLALGFKSLKSNGKYKFVWLYKGKFQLPEDEYKTKEDKITFQPVTIKANFVKREYDTAWQAVADEDATGFVASTAQNWFNAVYPGSGS